MSVLAEYFRETHHRKVEMQYNQYPFYIFNQDALKNYASQEAQMHHNEQQKYIAEMIKAIDDYIDASKKITLDYQRTAMNACISEIIARAME